MTIASLPDALRLPQSIARLVARLVRVMQPDAIVLFGSYAAGRAHARSDLDLLVVLPDESGAQELVRRRQQLAAGLIPHVDLVAATREELLCARGERASFLRSVFEHGVLLHSGARQPRPGLEQAWGVSVCVTRAPR